MLKSRLTNSVFYSSRRRHTRCSRDWSSDVCSSDLSHPTAVAAAPRMDADRKKSRRRIPLLLIANPPSAADRSEERRVGKESRSELARELSRYTTSIDIMGMNRANTILATDCARCQL